MTALIFDPNAQAASVGMETMPDHWATVVIVESEMKPTGGGSGAALNMTCLIQPGMEFAGRKVWIRLNLENESEKAVEIARGDLTAVCYAMGVRQAITNSEMLHGKPFDVKIKYIPEVYYMDIETQQPQVDTNGNPLVQYEAKNEIKAFKGPGEKAVPYNAENASAPLAGEIAQPVVSAAPVAAAVAQPAVAAVVATPVAAAVVQPAVVAQPAVAAEVVQPAAAAVVQPAVVAQPVVAQAQTAAVAATVEPVAAVAVAEQAVADPNVKVTTQSAAAKPVVQTDAAVVQPTSAVVVEPTVADVQPNVAAVEVAQEQVATEAAAEATPVVDANAGAPAWATK